MSNYMSGHQHFNKAAHKVPTFPPENENGSIVSDSNFAVAMPQNYQVKTSPNRPVKSATDQRLVMMAKHPNASSGDIENAMQHQQQQRIMRKQPHQFQQQQQQQQQQPYQPPPPHRPQQVGFQMAPQPPQPTPVAHHQPPSTNSPPRTQQEFQQGGFPEPWEESPAPKKSVFGKFVSKIKPEGPRDDASRDNSYAKSLASEKTRKVSNVDEKAREKRLKEEAKKQRQEAAAAERASTPCCACIYKTKTGLFISFVIITLLLAAILTMALGYGEDLFQKNAEVQADFDNLDDVETWIPRPIDTPGVFTALPSTSPTLSPTISNGGSGTIPTNPPLPTPRPTTREPTSQPSTNPTFAPVIGPTPQPTPNPTRSPTLAPSKRPTIQPSKVPTSAPTPRPTLSPTASPSISPTTSSPTGRPTEVPSSAPTFILDDLVPLGSALVGTASGQRFGYSVSLSEDGSVMAVGVPFATVSGAEEAGMVQVYEYISNRWIPRGPVLTGRNPEDKFGSALSISQDGNLLVVSEPNFEGSAGTNAGNVRTFRYNSISKSYQQIGRELEGVAAADRFGISMALNKSGTRLVVGAPYHDNSVDDRRLVSGEVQTFELVNETWEPIGTPLEGEAHFDWFGWKVDLNDDGDLLCVGAPRNLEFGGYVTCYEFVGANWKPLGNVIRNLAPTRYDDNFGHSLRVNRNRVAIGVPGRNHDIRNQDSGMVVVYEYDSGIWRRVGDSVTFSSPSRSDQMGFSVDLEGNTLAVGSPGRNSRGQVDLYYYNPDTNSWVPNPRPLTGNVGSTFGFSVSMTRYLAVGSAVSNGQNTGQVNIFRQT